MTERISQTPNNICIEFGPKDLSTENQLERLDNIFPIPNQKREIKIDPNEIYQTLTKQFGEQLTPRQKAVIFAAVSSPLLSGCSEGEIYGGIFALALLVIGVGIAGPTKNTSKTIDEIDQIDEADPEKRRKKVLKVSKKRRNRQDAVDSYVAQELGLQDGHDVRIQRNTLTYEERKEKPSIFVRRRVIHYSPDSPHMTDNHRTNMQDVALRTYFQEHLKKGADPVDLIMAASRVGKALGKENSNKE